ncbi:iron-sulfur-binding ferredoxin reductase [Stutzerimonas zhaodongensis]|uniref:iron-sulfur-binding ferredoxin reductase n=1 Tax=Stutzerimonas zhaodongensis TaxID=1176257 RepID=UPI002101EBA1|nr:iron-sulfur-binding ferredoxin reductase [Stutzerimonas zhaodongensis]
MPEITHQGMTWTVATGTNLLDALNGAGLNVPHSCRAGSCHVCLVRCLDGEPDDAHPEALDPARRLEGWRLACQCSVSENLSVAVFDPAREGLPAHVQGLDWLSEYVLRLRLIPERPLRYHAGQHVLLWSANGLARPYSLASIPFDERWLEFHIDCARPGAFSNVARSLAKGDQLMLGQLHAGALRYDPDWQSRPLLLMAAGTGLAPLWGVLREALRQGHEGPIRLIHVCHSHSYLQAALADLAEQHANLSVEMIVREQLAGRLQALRVTSRHELALICGGSDFVDACSKRMFLAGLPRGQILGDAFITRQVEG